MNLTYNGVKLQICHFNTFSMKSVSSKDGADYLFTHFYIDVSAQWNPLATASLNGQIKQPPAGVSGDGPALSIATLRDTLMQKRQYLVVDIGGTVILEAPQTFDPEGVAVVDANNGPEPLHCFVDTFSGIKTANVHFIIECWLNETGRVGNEIRPPNVFISNRWEQSEDIDRTFRSTLHVEGEVVFRPDLIVFAQHRPDTFRGQFVLPIQNGFQRKNLHVTASSDGLRINYSFRDEQAEGNYQILPGSPIVEASGRTWYDLDWLGTEARLPTMQIGADVEVWGRNSSTRTQLANAVVRALASLNGSLGAAVTAGRQASLHQYLSVDFPRRHASGSVTFALNGLFGATRILGGGADALIAVQNAPLFQDFSAPPLWQQGGAAVQNIGPPAGVRSEAAIALVTQALLTPGAIPGNTPVSLTTF